MVIIGHKNIVSFLEKALENKALSHAYCFVGPDSVGKRTMACYLASKILNTEPEKLSTHPDFFHLVREVDEKKGKLKKDLSVAQAKQVRNFLQNRSWFENGTRITVIDEAELLNSEAANALLKTIEETNDNSLMFLLTTDDKALPATVRSRCQVINFDLVSDDEIVAGLKKMDFAGQAAKEAADLAWGRPGRAVQLLKDPELLQEYKNELERWQKLLSQPFYAKLKNTEDLFDDKDQSRGGEKIKRTVDVWIMLWREFLLKQIAGKKDSAMELPSDKILEIIDDLRAVRGYLNRNINPRLLMEQILLKF